MNLPLALPNSSPASAEPGNPLPIITWGLIALLALSATLANASGPRRFFLALALLVATTALIRNTVPLLRRYGLACLPFFAIVLLSALWSPLPAVTLVDALTEVIAPISAGLMAITTVRRIKPRHLWWPFALTVLAACLSVLGGLNIHFGFWPSAPSWITKAYAGRGVASTIGVILTLSGLALLLIRLEQPESPRVYRLLGGILIVAGLLLGGIGHNRMYWFALLLGLLPWLPVLHQHLGRRFYPLVAGLFLLLASGIIYTSYYLRQGPEAREVHQAYASDLRWAFWQEWAVAIAEQPLHGYGYGSRVLPQIGAQHISSRNESWNAIAQYHAHNVLLNLLVQTGLLGLMAFLWMLRSLHHTLVAADGLSPGDRALMTAMRSLFLGALAKSMTDDFFWGPAGILMWILCGIFLGMASRQTPAAPEACKTTGA